MSTMNVRICRFFLDIKKPFNFIWDYYSLLRKICLIYTPNILNGYRNDFLLNIQPKIQSSKGLSLNSDIKLYEPFKGITFLVLLKKLSHIGGSYCVFRFNLTKVQEVFFNFKSLISDQQFLPVGLTEIKNKAIFTLTILGNAQISRYSLNKLDRKFPKLFNCTQIVPQALKWRLSKNGSYFCCFECLSA